MHDAKPRVIHISPIEKHLYISPIESHAFLRGVRDMLPRKFFKKWCNLVCFEVYFAAILSEKNCKKVHFLYKSYRYCITAHYIGVLKHTPQNVYLLGNLVRLGINFDYISIKDRGASMGGRVGLWASPPGKKSFFFFMRWGMGHFFHVGTFCYFFATLIFSMCLTSPPLPTTISAPPPRSPVQ